VICLIDLGDLTWTEIWQLLCRYMSSPGESGRWLPIVALVYLMFESTSLGLFWQKSPRHPRQESDLRRCNSRLLAGYRRRTISCILLMLLLGAFITLSILCQHSFLYYLAEIKVVLKFKRPWLSFFMTKTGKRILFCNKTVYLDELYGIRIITPELSCQASRVHGLNL